MATVLTQVVVDSGDPAFQCPTKPIGPFYTRSRAQKLMEEKDWDMVEDSGRGYRRVVPSPMPREIVELPMIRALIDVGLVIAAGGGGIPVVRRCGLLHGVEAVVDKDFASSLLASEIGADLILIITSVERVCLNFNESDEKPLSELGVDEAETHLNDGQFPPGSMGPKIQAAISYLRSGGREVLITDITNLDRALLGKTGTRIHL